MKGEINPCVSTRMVISLHVLYSLNHNKGRFDHYGEYCCPVLESTNKMCLQIDVTTASKLIDAISYTKPRKIKVHFSYANKSKMS